MKRYRFEPDGFGGVIEVPDEHGEHSRYSDAIAEIEKKDKGIAELRERLEKSWERGDILAHDSLKVHVKLSRLTAALKDDERAKKVAGKYIFLSNPTLYSGIREDAITDYRAMLKEEMK